MAIGGCSGGGEDGAGPTDGPDASPTDPADALAAPGTAGLIGEDWYQGRIDENLRIATSEANVGSIVGIAAQLVRADREPDCTWDVDGVTVDSFADTFEMIDEWADTRDLRTMYFHWLLALGRGDTSSTRLDSTSTAGPRTASNGRLSRSASPGGRRARPRR